MHVIKYESSTSDMADNDDDVDNWDNDKSKEYMLDFFGETYLEK